MLSPILLKVLFKSWMRRQNTPTANLQMMLNEEEKSIILNSRACLGNLMMGTTKISQFVL